MIKICYVEGVTEWIKISDLREKMLECRSKGGQFKLVGNLSVKCQAALLKFLEEMEEGEIVTSNRLLSTVESRGVVEGTCKQFIFPRLFGLYLYNPRAALNVATLIRNNRL